MSQMSTVGSQIGNAWGSLRQGNHNEALTAFETILKDAPRNVDAYYGLGLAQMKAGQESKAIETFQKALETAQELLQAIRGQMGGTDSQNSIETTEDDRYMMLTRMIRQRLMEMGVQTH